jgi:hypothetical protein
MGGLDERRFSDAIAKCSACGAAAFEVASYIDRQISVMLGERNDDGRWVHDGEKFIDGVYRIRCLACGAEPFATDDCPRCHHPGVLATALGAMSKLEVPKRCPSCKGTEVTMVGFAPATVRTGEAKRPSPSPVALLGDPGFHVAAISCDSCNWVAVAEGCPICGGAGPLRVRPG